jgi:hypothetical protein
MTRGRTVNQPGTKFLKRLVESKSSREFTLVTKWGSFRYISHFTRVDGVWSRERRVEHAS